MTLTATRPRSETTPGLESVFSLARFEGRRLVAHPVFWLGAIAWLAICVDRLWDFAPVLNRMSVTITWTLIPLAAAVALVTGWAVQRARGTSDAQPTTVMPLAMDRRVAGILLGLGWPAAATFLLQLSLFAWAWTRGPVTSIVWTEVLAGPVYIIFAGAVGALMSRWLPHVFTPLMSVLVVGALAAISYPSEQWGNEIGLSWLRPIAFPQDVIPYEVTFRPAGLHLAYLVGLALLVSGLAIAGRWRVSWQVMGVGAVLAVTMGIAQLGPIEESRQTEVINRLVGDDAELTCEVHSGVSYCAMPGYERWIQRWADSTEDMLAAAPPGTIDGIEVRQYPVHYAFQLLDDPLNHGTPFVGDSSRAWWETESAEDLAARPGVEPAGTQWWLDFDPRSFSNGMAWRIVPGEFGERSDGNTVVLVWLQSQHPEVGHLVQSQTEYELISPVWCLVSQLLDKPDHLELVHSNWDQLIADTTTYDDAARILDVAPVGPLNEDGLIAGGCP